MNIFLTGATGFIGKYAARELLAAGHSVRALARDPARLGGLLPLGVQPVHGSLADARALREGMRGCEVIVHLAGHYAMWSRTPELFWQVNVDGARAVMQAAIESGARRVVHMSTVAVWGRPAACPFDEDTPRAARLLSQYARSKAAGERAAREMCAAAGLPLTVLYPGIVLGAGDDRPSGDYIRLLAFRRTPSDIFPNTPVTYVAVRDVAAALRLAVENPAAAGRGYLIGSETLLGRDFTDLVSRLSGAPRPPLRLPDWLVRAASYPFTALAQVTGRPPLWTLSVDAGRTMHAGFCFDGSRAARELGLRYTPVRDALDEAIRQYRREKS